MNMELWMQNDGNHSPFIYRFPSMKLHAVGVGGGGGEICPIVIRSSKNVIEICLIEKKEKTTIDVFFTTKFACLT